MAPEASSSNKQIVNIFNKFNEEHKIIDILPTHSKVLSLDRNISIKTGLAALWEQRTAQWVVWDPLRSTFNGTLVLRDFLDVLFRHENCSSLNSDSPLSPSLSNNLDNMNDSSKKIEFSNYSHLIEHMENNILK